MSALKTSFDSKFEVLEADTPKLLDMAFSLRYQVYCLETGFEDKNQFPDGRERDEFDRHALHGLVISKAAGIPVGTLRLVRPDLSRPAAPFPMEQHYPNLLTLRGYSPSRLPRESTAEISRFAISKDFKRRAGEAGTPAGVSNKSLHEAYVRRTDERRVNPHIIILGLFKALAYLSAKARLTHWLALTEYPVLRLWDRFGFKFEMVGDPIEFHGLRQPCVGKIDDMLARVHRVRPDVWDFMTEQDHLGNTPAEVGRGKRTSFSRHEIGWRC